LIQTTSRSCSAVLQVDGDELAHALLGHGDAEEPVHAGHGDGIVGDDDEAGLGGSFTISSIRLQ
jgi:hypothetical protein